MHDVCCDFFFIRNFNKIVEVIFDLCLHSSTRMTNMYCRHPRELIQIWLKIWLIAIAQSTCRVSLEIISNLIPTQKTETFSKPQRVSSTFLLFVTEVPIFSEGYLTLAFCFFCLYHTSFISQHITDSEQAPNALHQEKE